MTAVNATSRELMLSSWKKLCEDERFDGAPFEFEVTPEGEIIMSPTNSRFHPRLQFLLGRMIEQHAPHGECAVELATLTPHGVFEIDVAWSPGGVRIKGQDIADPAPEICVEIVSPSNRKGRIEMKRDAYFAAGALEVWLVNQHGDVTFYVHDQPSVPSRASALIPSFPAKVL